MDVYVIDTNIVFTAAMNPNSPIGRFIMATRPSDIRFHAPVYLQLEINRHVGKLMEASKLSGAEVREQLDLVCGKIDFMPDSDIPMSYYLNAVGLVREVDMDDLVFVAMNDYLNSLLWTGDTTLYRHLISKGYERVVNFEEIKQKYS